METGKSLYQRLGGYDAIAAVAIDLLPRLMNDQLLGVSGRTARRTASPEKSSY